LRRIDKQKLDFACRLFQCLVVSKRPLLVEELAELFAIQPDVGTIPTYNPSYRPLNPEESVLSVCSTLVAVVNNGGQKIVQFSHFSVREYLTSDRIPILEPISRFRILLRPAHALLASTCLSVLLQPESPLASYAAQYWVDHAQFEAVSSEIQVQREMECLFDKDKPHFAAWNLLYNIDDRYSYRIPPQSVPLYYAVLCGFRHLVEHLVDAHPQDVNAQGGRHVTPLHAALEEGDWRLAMLLLERGANIEFRGPRSRAPLHTASYRGYADVVSSLIDLGADPNTETDNRETPLYLVASEYGREDVAKLLLEHRADPNRQNAEGFTPLRAAWQGGHVDNVRLLLRYGADPRSPDNRGKSPLHVVLQESHYSDILHLGPPVFSSPAFLEHRFDIVKLLLELGADANYPDKDGETSLHVALRRGFVDIVPLLLNHDADTNYPDKDGETSLHIALQRSLIDTIPLLLNRGADTNYPGNHGKTSLHMALRRGLIVTARLLLHHGADAYHPDKFKITPLHVALQMDNDEVIRLLLDFIGSDSRTLLHAGSQKGHDDIVGSLLNHGADPNHPDNDGLTALHAAAEKGHDNIVLLLIYHGADVNRSDNNGRSPLRAAVSPNGHDTVVQLLLDHGATANHPDRDGWTPLHAASQEGHGDIVRLLLDRCAAPNHRDNRGRTPLHIAWEKSKNHRTFPHLLLRPDTGANCLDSDDWTLLGPVSKKSNNYIIRLLLKHGADANLPDSSGLTPLHVALAGTVTTSTSYHSAIAEVIRPVSNMPRRRRLVFTSRLLYARLPSRLSFFA
jgi:ankyrin repeat protein